MTTDAELCRQQTEEQRKEAETALLPIIPVPCASTSERPRRSFGRISMSYDMVFLKDALEIAREPISGKLGEAMVQAEDAVRSGQHERVEIRNEDEKIIFCHPRVKFGAP
jgi:hypothetical protein